MWFWGAAALFGGLLQNTVTLNGQTMSFSENPEQDRQHHRNDNARGQGKIKLEIFRLENKISRQPAQIQFLQKWP
jgi:hypothetical protein